MISAPKTAAYYLRQMTDFAKKFNEANIDTVGWAAKKRYVRINGGGLRPVSLCHASPCGSLDGVKTRRHPSRLEEALGKDIPRPGHIRRKPEHRVQAALIEHALRWPEKLAGLLHLQDECDAIRFVTDEFKVDEIRADVVMLGRKASIWFPIFVELKASRSKKQVVGQVLKIRDKVSAPDVAQAFVEFLRAAVKDVSPNEQIDLRRSIAMIIWPAAQGTALSLDETLQQGVRVLEFDGAKEFARPYRSCEQLFHSKTG